MGRKRQRSRGFCVVGVQRLMIEAMGGFVIRVKKHPDLNDDWSQSELTVGLPRSVLSNDCTRFTTV